MSDKFRFTNPYPTRAVSIVGAAADTDVVLLTDDKDGDFVTITYTGADASQWFSFSNTEISDVVVAGVLNRSGATTRFTDNEQGVAALSTLWVNDNAFAAPGTTWQDDIINFFDLRIDIIQDPTGTPVQRSYTIVGSGRQSSLARQPANILVRTYRTF